MEKLTLNQRVTGSNPVAPTTPTKGLRVFQKNQKSAGEQMGSKSEKLKFNTF